MSQRVMGTPSELVSRSTAAKMLKVHLSTIDHMTKKGLLTLIRQGRKGYFYRTDVVAVAGMFEGRTSFASTTNLARRAFVKAEACEKKLGELMDMLGFTHVELGVSEKEVIDFYQKAKELLDYNEPYYQASVVFFFAKRCLGLTEKYFGLVGQVTKAAEPWRPFLEATQKMCELAPRELFVQDFELASAFGYLEAARKHVRATSYFYLLQTEGRRVAHDAFIGDSAFDPIIPLLQQQ